MRFALALAAALLTLSLAAGTAAASPFDVTAGAAAIQPNTCKGGKVPVTVGKKTTCKPVGKVLPSPRATDPRLAHLEEALTYDPAKALKGKKRKRARTPQSGFGAAGKRARKKILKALPKALAFIDRKSNARAMTAPVGLAYASAGCQAGPAGPVGQTGGASVGTLGDNGGFVDAPIGDGLRLRVTFVSCGGVSKFRIPECPTANGGVDGSGQGEFQATIEVRDGNRVVSRSSSVFEEKAKVHGEVGPDAKLKFIDVEHTQEVFIVASGGIVVRGGVTLKVRIAMPGGKYDPAAASVRYFGDSIAPNSGADAFAGTAASALRVFSAAEPRWSTFNPPGGHCAEPVFSPDSNTLKLKLGDRKQLAIYAKAKADGGRATAARWTLLNPENAGFSEHASQSPAPDISYTVTQAPPGGQVKVTVKFTSTAGVGEKTWAQPVDGDTIDEISGTYSMSNSAGGSNFEWAGNVKFERVSPAILGPVDGSFNAVSGLYEFRVSGKATLIATDQCSMRGSGQFAISKEGSNLTVFSRTLDGQPPYEYSFGISSDFSGGSLPMIEIETYACSKPAEELEGDRFEYPATLGMSLTAPESSKDGREYAGSKTQTQGPLTVSEAWSFTGS